MHLEAVGFGATAPGASGAAAAAFTGDSLTIKNARTGSRILIVGHISDQQTLGWQQMTHPSGHDTTRGYRASVPTGVTGNLLPVGLSIPMQPQELMSVTILGSATAGDIEQGVFLVWYEDSPFVVGHLITNDELMSRAVDVTTVQLSLATGTAGGWSGSEAINADSDLLRANTDYAILGVTSTAECLAVGIRAPDFGGQRVAIPAGAGWQQEQAEWFPRLAQETKLPMIPVFNSANRANILIDAAQDENGADFVGSIILAQLKT